MSEKKKNKIHNPQFITDAIPSNIDNSDIGRLWIDRINKKIVVGLPDDKNQGMMVDIITTVDQKIFESNISEKYFSKVDAVYATVVPQTNGDKHYDQGYDFFTDIFFLENSTQEIDDYYSFFYIEVPDTSTLGYRRTILTTAGEKHIRNATGADNYVYNSNYKKVVNYSKIILPFMVKDIIELKFENHDVVDRGFELQNDMKTILIYGDPEGFFINKKVKVRYIS